jgi:hypothetical protein
MYEIYDNRTNEVVFTHILEQVCINWIDDMADFKDFEFLFIRKVEE